MCERFEQTLGESTVVLTGGLAPLIAPYTTVTDFVEPWLTLHGLRLVYERNGGAA
jgi:type III pantothenate kinase